MHIGLDLWHVNWPGYFRKGCSCLIIIYVCFRAGNYPTAVLLCFLEGPKLSHRKSRVHGFGREFVSRRNLLSPRWGNLRILKMRPVDSIWIIIIIVIIGPCPGGKCQEWLSGATKVPSASRINIFMMPVLSRSSWTVRRRHPPLPPIKSYAICRLCPARDGIIFGVGGFDPQ